MVKRRDFVMYAGGTTAALSALSVQSQALQSAVDTRKATSSEVKSVEPTEKTPASALGNVLDPSYIDTRLDSRSISFENPTGARASGGEIGHGRKGHPFYILEPGEKIVLANIKGPGTVRHIWVAGTVHLTSGTPEVARSLRLEAFYDGLLEPSISVPLLDFFGLPHGRVAEYYSALTSVNQGRGLNCNIPMPFRHSIRVEFTNESARHIRLFYQIDYTLERSIPQDPSYLHVSFRRENPTTLRRDFVIADGFKGPGRFLGCSVGIRPLSAGWYGEGEVKIYRDGDRAYPTYCGTGLEDYVGSASGMERHYGPYSGVPTNILTSTAGRDPSFVGFYRWHLPDPIMFSEDIRVTIQQIGSAERFKKGQESAYASYKATHIAAGPGWIEDEKLSPNMPGFAIVERSDDYCAAAFVYCAQPQPVPRFKTDLAVRDVGWSPAEMKSMPPDAQDSWERSSIELKRYWGGPIK